MFNVSHRPMLGVTERGMGGRGNPVPTVIPMWEGEKGVARQPLGQRRSVEVVCMKALSQREW